MMIILLLVLFSISSITASQTPNIPSQNGEGIGIYNGGLLGASLGVLLLAREWRYERDMRFKAHVSGDGESALLTYSPEQRNVAKKRQHSVFIGLLSLATGLCPHSSTLINQATRIRSLTSTASVLEQGLVPTVICGTTQELLKSALPHLPANVSDVLSVSASYAIPRGAAFLGVSPERMLIHSFLIYLSGDLHNQYRNVPFLQLLTYSFQSASRSVPLLQAVGSATDTRANCFTLCTPRYRHGDLNLKQEFHYAVVPIAVHTAFGFTARAFATTPAGKKIENKIDEQLVPIFGEEQSALLKSIGFECGIGLCTFAALKGAEKVAKDGCNMM